MFDYNDILEIKKAYFNKLQDLEKSNDQEIDLITKEAEAERTYLIAKEQATAKLRIDGEPSTLIKDLVKGKTAQQKFDYEIAKGVVKAHRANIKVIYTKIDALRSFLSSAKEQAKIQ